MSERISLSTHIQKKSSPHQLSNAQIILTSCFAIIFFMIGVFLLKFLLEGKRDEIQKQSSVEYESESLQKNSLLFNQFQLALKNQEPKVEQNFLATIEVFQILKQQSQQKKEQTLDMFFEQYTKLFAIRHPKLTSPSSQTLSWYQWLLMPPENYQEIEKIFTKENNSPWKSQGNMLTISDMSGSIVPSLLKIKIPRISARELYLWGVQPQPNQHTLEAYLIDKFSLKQDENILPCMTPKCNVDYSMLLLQIDEMLINQIRVYKKKDQYY